MFHVSLLKQYRPSGTYQPPMPYELEGDLVYDVERIIDHRYVKRGRGPQKLQYLVKWEGYGPEHDSWEPEVNLRDAPEPLSKYAEYLQQTGQELQPPTAAKQRLRPAQAKKRKRGGRGGSAKRLAVPGGKRTKTTPSDQGPSSVDAPPSGTHVAAEGSAFEARQTDASRRPSTRNSTRKMRSAQQDQSRRSGA